MSAATPPRRFADPAQEAAGLLIRLGVAVLAIGVPCGAIFSRRLIFSMVPVGAALVLLGVVLSPRRADLTRLRELMATPTALTAFFLLGWVGLTLIWTPFGHLAAERYFKTAGTLLLAALAAACLPGHTKTSNLYLLPLGLGVAALGTLVTGLVAALALRSLAPSMPVNPLRVCVIMAASAQAASATCESRLVSIPGRSFKKLRSIRP